MDIHEKLDAMIEQENRELPPLEAPWKNFWKRWLRLKKRIRRQKRDPGRKGRTEKKSHGWKSYLLRRKKKNDEEENLAKEDDAGDLTEGTLENGEE